MKVGGAGPVTVATGGCWTNARRISAGHGDGHDLEPVLERLDEGDALHAAAGDAERHDGAEHDDADPLGTAHGHLQGDARPLELGEQVEAADQDHGRRWRRGAGPDEPSRPSAKSGMVYAPKRRSGAATAASRTRYPAA